MDFAKIGQIRKAKTGLAKIGPFLRTHNQRSIGSFQSLQMPCEVRVVKGT